MEHALKRSLYHSAGGWAQQLLGYLFALTTAIAHGLLYISAEGYCGTPRQSKDALRLCYSHLTSAESY